MLLCVAKLVELVFISVCCAIISKSPAKDMEELTLELFIHSSQNQVFVLCLIIVKPLK